MQFAGCNIRRRADPKRALEIFVRQGREMDGRGTKGYQFDSNRRLRRSICRWATLRRLKPICAKNVALIVEARTSGLPGWRASYPGMGQSWEAIVESHRATIFEARGTVSRRGSILSACRTTFARRHQITDGDVRRILRPKIRFCGSADLWLWGKVA